MKYVNQKQYPHIPYITRTDPDCDRHEYGKTTTISTSGCGLCAAVMVADRLIPNCTFELEDALALSYEVKANHGIGTDYNLFAPAFAEKLGLTWEQTDDFDRLRQCVRTGGAAVLLVKANGDQPGLFTRSLHYITVIGEEPDGRFAILDPSLTEGKYEEYDRKGKAELKKDVLILCCEENVRKEVTEAPLPLNLFWRK